MNSTKTRKTKLRKVELRFFQDDANGEWGLTHKDTREGNGSDSGFNAFWDGRGIFHDVFEHAHEFTNKYFRGSSAMNMGGEVAAMGSLWYFYSQCGYSARLGNGYKSPDEVTLDSTLSDMQEAIEYGHARYGDTLECSVPHQKDTGDTSLEWMIEEHFARVQACQPGKHDDQADGLGQGYKDSVTLEKLANLYRYGYRMAEKLFPDSSYRNGLIMQEFSEFWDAFCKQNDAEQLANLYKGIDVTIYRDADGLLCWTAKLETKYGIPSDEVENVTLKGDCDGCPRVYSLTF